MKKRYTNRKGFRLIYSSLAMIQVLQMRHILLIWVAITVLPVVVSAQKSPLKWESKTYDYGTVSDWDNPPAEFTFTNNGKRPVLFLPLFYQRDVRVQLPDKPIQPGETANLIVYYYTAEPGAFNRQVKLYVNVSGDPIYLTVKGNIKSIYASALTACPAFGPSMPIQKPDEELTILVIDKETEKPIPSAMVEVRKKSRPELREFTNGKGTVKAKLDIGTYVIEARKNKYIPVESEIYVNMRSGVITIPLEKERDEPPAWALSEPEPEGEPEIEPPFEEEEIIIIESNLNDQYEEPAAEESEPEVVTQEEPQEEVEVVDDGLLSRKLYNANNIVFLIDVSGSMRRDNKMDMLRTSIKELVSVLREIDKITVITYATSTNELLSTTNADQKQYINELIDSLTPGGWTNGVLGLQEAYENVEKNFLDGGNNQIILATDGKFNSSSFSEGDLMDMIKAKSDANIKLSVVGFGQSESAQRMMKRMANKGKGNYMQILPGQADLSLLVEEIKANSRKVN